MPTRALHWNCKRRYLHATFRELRSDISDAFDDKFRTDVYWVNGLRAPGEFVSEATASEHQKFLRITHDNRTTFRLIRSDLGVDLFGAGEDTRNYSDASDYLASVAIRLPEAVGTAWMGIRATRQVWAVQRSTAINWDYGATLIAASVRLCAIKMATVMRLTSKDRFRELTVTLPEWITLTVITYKQRIAFFVDGHFVVAIEDALTLGGTVALGVDNGTTADFDDLIIRDTTPHDG